MSTLTKRRTLKRPTYVKPITKRAFNALSIHERRVVMAKDVIVRLKLRMLKPSNGNLFPPSTRDTLCPLGAGALQKRLNSTKQEPCEGCAKGALLLSWIGLFNSYNGDALSGFTYETYERTPDHYYPKGLLDTFGARLLNAIESAFENRYYSHHESSFTMITFITFDAICHHFGSAAYKPEGYAAIKDTTPLLIAILTNVVKNRGRMVVGVRPNQIVIE